MRALAALLILAPLAAGCLEAAVPLQTPDAGEPLGEHVTGETGWPELEEAIIRPGVLLHGTNRACVSNFVFTRPDNTSVFLGLAAHCVRDMAVGEILVIDPGRTDATAVLIYSSWATMSEWEHDDPVMWEYNDFAVVRIDDRFRHLVHPAALERGGPTALADSSALGAGERVLAYAPLGAAAPGWRPAVLAPGENEWALLAYGLPPGAPGTFGGGVVDEEGRAVGLLVSLGVAPNPGANAVARLDKVMGYAREHANLLMDLRTWEPLAARSPI